MVASDSSDPTYGGVWSPGFYIDIPNPTTSSLTSSSSISSATNSATGTTTSSNAATVTVNASANATPDDDPSSGGLTSGAKAGVGVGVGLGIPLILALIALTLVLWRRKNRSEKSAALQAPSWQGPAEADSTIYNPSFDHQAPKFSMGETPVQLGVQHQIPPQELPTYK